MEPSSEIKSLFESQRALSVLAFYAKLGICAEIFYLCHIGIPTIVATFDSESFELELNGRAWDTSGSSFVQNPSGSSVVQTP